jgi:quercetin dioxygenase-like cupin family protein
LIAPTTSCRNGPCTDEQLGIVMNIEQQFDRVCELWSPRVIGRVNDQYVKIAKVRGEFTWHRHDDEDELFLVVRGRLRIQLEDGELELGPGDFHVVPKGVMHNPVADEECWVMLIETVTTKHTGDVTSPLTKTIEQQLAD